MMRITEKLSGPRLVALSVLFMALWSGATAAQAEIITYDRCIALTRVDPDAAFDAALSWADTDLTGGASHCAGIALIGLGLYDAAAERFTRAALNGQNMKDVERATLHQQAGDAWLLANNGAQAAASFSQSLIYVPEDPQLLFGRARGYELEKQTAPALQDVNLAIANDPTFGAAYLLRGRLYRQSKQFDAANADIEAAMANGIDEVAARLERGLVRFEQGNEAGALEDWQAVVTEDRRPDGSAGPAAMAASGFIAEVARNGPTQP